MPGRYRRFIILAILVAVADQALKIFMMGLLEPGQARQVIPGLLNLVMWHNPGAAFGGLGDWAHSRWILAIIAAVAVVVCLWLLRGQWGRSMKVATCLGLVAGGAIGNLVDRIRFGWVVDYILVYYGDWYWPAFNLADIAITVSGILLVIFLWRMPQTK